LVKSISYDYRGFRTDVYDQRELCPSGEGSLNGLFRIARQWGLKPVEQRVLLGDLPQTTFNRYQKLPEVQLSRDLLERVSYVLGIYKALHILFQDSAQADGWLRRPNQVFPFNGNSALEYLLQGSLTRLAEVRAYLDAQRG